MNTTAILEKRMGDLRAVIGEYTPGVISPLVLGVLICDDGCGRYVDTLRDPGAATAWKLGPPDLCPACRETS